MDAAGRYIVSVSAAAILCGIIKNIFPSKSTNAALLHLASGIFLSLVAIQPLARIDLKALPAIPDAYLSEAQSVSEQGQFLARDSMEDIIKSQSEAYILDKARELGADLTVEITLSDANPPAPNSVRLTGKISPYGKSRLQAIILEDLGIPKENQIWIG